MASQEVLFTNSESPGSIPKRELSGAAINRVANKDKPFHEWYRFVLSFPPHLVRHYLENFDLRRPSVILDPFCGTGTTLVECKLNGYGCLGVEANPFAHFASSVKIRWEIDIDELERISSEISEKATLKLLEEGIDDAGSGRCPSSGVETRELSEEKMRLILKDSVSPMPLHKMLVLLDHIHEHTNRVCYDHLLLAFAKTLVYRVSNLRFGPEVGIGKAKKDLPVVSAWIGEVRQQIADLRGHVNSSSWPDSDVIRGDSRELGVLLNSGSADAVITSPPYPNEKDYSRTTRLESVVLGFINTKDELRRFKKEFIRSNTRGIYKEDQDASWIADDDEIQTLARTIENRRIELNKDSGFERMYASVTKQYFGGMARHLESLKQVLKPGARLAYVVGDQASYFRIKIRTGYLIGRIAERMGYKLVRTDLFRTRFATATGDQLREEVVILVWQG